MNEKSENRKALPKFALTMLASLAVGGVLGVVLGGYGQLFSLPFYAVAVYAGRRFRASLLWSFCWFGAYFRLFAG